MAWTHTILERRIQGFACYSTLAQDVRISDQIDLTEYWTFAACSLLVTVLGHLESELEAED